MLQACIFSSCSSRPALGIPGVSPRQQPQVCPGLLVFGWVRAGRHVVPSRPRGSKVALAQAGGADGAAVTVRNLQYVVCSLRPAIGHASECLSTSPRILTCSMHITSSLPCGHFAARIHESRQMLIQGSMSNTEEGNGYLLLSTHQQLQSSLSAMW
jgi:hypothetical protein